MATTAVDIDNRLLTQGMRVFKCKSKRELVNLALTELLKKEKRKEILALRGKVKWEANLDELRGGRL
jgi:Arc/MetJ family transcription regulator